MTTDDTPTTLASQADTHDHDPGADADIDPDAGTDIDPDAGTDIDPDAGTDADAGSGIAVVRELDRDDRNAVHEVRLDGRRAVRKHRHGAIPDDRRFGPAGAAGPVAVEAAVLRRLADGPVPVPALFAAGDRTLVTEYAAGDRYDAGDGRRRRAARLRELGATLARLHAATAGRFDGHGPVTPVGGGSGGPDGDPDADVDTDADGDGSRAGPRLAVVEGRPWGRRLADRVEDWRAALADTPFASVADRARALVRERRAAFDRATPALVHGDVDPAHVRFRPGGTAVTTLLDWERAAAAPGLWDLAWAELSVFESPHTDERDTSLRSALYGGYRSVRSLPDGWAWRRDAYRGLLTVRELRDADRLPGGLPAVMARYADRAVEDALRGGERA